MKWGGFVFFLLFLGSLPTLGESIDRERWLSDPNAALAKTCEISGRQGVLDLGRTFPIFQTQLDDWISATTSSPLDSPSQANELYRFCPKAASCGLSANWFFSMHPEPRLRREAVFLAAHNMNWRLRKAAPTTLSDLRVLMNSFDFSKPSMSQLALKYIHDLKTVNEEAANSGGVSLAKKGLPAFCIAAQGKDCAKAIIRLYEEVSPAHLSAEKMNSPVPHFALTVAVPVTMEKIFTDARYGRALQILNNKMLDNIENLESSLIRRETPSASVGFLDEDLTRAIREAFQCQSVVCITEYKLDILEFYGSRGTSFLGLINYLPSETYPTLTEFGLFANLLNYLESLQFATRTHQNGFYSLKSPLTGDCLHPKPYHLLFSQALVQRLLSEGYSRKGIAEATLALSFAYRIASESLATVDSQVINNPSSGFYQIKRVDLIYNAIGILTGLSSGFQLSPSLTLAGMNQIRGNSQVAFEPETFNAWRPSELSVGKRLYYSVLDLTRRWNLAEELGMGELDQILKQALP